MNELWEVRSFLPLLRLKIATANVRSGGGLKSIFSEVVQKWAMTVLDAIHVLTAELKPHDFQLLT